MIVELLQKEKVDFYNLKNLFFLTSLTLKKTCGIILKSIVYFITIQNFVLCGDVHLFQNKRYVYAGMMFLDLCEAVIGIFKESEVKNYD